MSKFIEITPEMILLQVSDGLAQLHDLLQIVIEMQEENAEGLRCDGVGAGAIKYYLARSELTDSLMCSIIEKVAALEDQARMGSK